MCPAQHATPLPSALFIYFESKFERFSGFPGNCSRLSNAALAVAVVASTWHDFDSLPLAAHASLHCHRTLSARSSGVFTGQTQQTHTNINTNSNTRTQSVGTERPSNIIHAEVKIVDTVNICTVSHMSICCRVRVPDSRSFLAAL